MYNAPWKSIVGWIWNRPSSIWERNPTQSGLASFREKQKVENAFNNKYLGKKDVLLSKIVGSVGRYNDFNSQFLLKDDRESYRLKRIKEAMNMGKYLPPIELYKIKDDYYVLDGNHRVSAAKEFKYTTIKAHIVEFLPSKDTLENIIYQEKTSFLTKTGLPEAINLTAIGWYSYLLEQIIEHQCSLEEQAYDAVTVEQASQDWYKTIYLPMIQVVKHSQLIQAFPKRTIADLYAYISYYQWKKGRKKRQFKIGIDKQIPKSMERFRAKMMEKEELDMPEMKRTVSAFLHINVESGKEDRIIEKLFTYAEIKEVYVVPGDFDIIVKIIMDHDLIEPESEVVSQFIQNKVRKLPGVIKTKTIIPFYTKQKDNAIVN